MNKKDEEVDNESKVVKRGDEGEREILEQVSKNRQERRTDESNF